MVLPILSLRSRARTSLFLAAALMVQSFSGTVAADGLADEADLQFQIGTRCFRAGDYEGALEHFLASNRLVRNRNVLFNIAGAYEALARFPEAHRYYIAALEAETDVQFRGEVSRAIARLAPRVAVLSVETDPPEATVYFDRRELGARGRSGRPLAVTPGQYRVLVEREGYEPAESEPINVALGATATVRLRLTRIVGTVRVEGHNGATARLDDDEQSPRCTVPCVLETPPGPHTVHIEQEGFVSESRVATVTARATTTVTVPLRPLTGSLVVDVGERDARIEIDGRAAGFAPIVLRDLPVGAHRIRVSLPGFAEIDRTMTIRANDEAHLDRERLVPLREVRAASRRAEQVEDAPASVSVISAAEINAFQYNTIAEAVQGQRGVVTSNDRAYNSIGIRGLGQPNDYGNRVVVLQDGAALNDNLLYSSYVGHDGRVGLADVDQIEIVRGPGSVLYGTGALSGVINLSTQRRDVRTGASFGLSGYGDGVGRARAAGNIRLSQDAGVSLSVALANSQGSTLDVVIPGLMGSPSVTQSVRGVDRIGAMTLSSRAWWKDITAQLFVTLHRHDIPVGVYGTTIGDSRTQWTDGRGLFELRYEPKIGQTFQLLTRLHANFYRFLGNYAYVDGMNVESENSENYLGVWGGAEVRGVWTPVQQLKLSLGGEAQYHPFAQLNGQSVADRTMANAVVQYLSVNRQYSVLSGYGLAEWNPLSVLHLTAGMRVDAFSTVAPGVSFRLASIFRFNPSSTLKLMGGGAFRAPSTYEQSYTDSRTQRPSCPTMPCTLRPERAYTGEIEFTQRIGEDWSFLVATNAGVLIDRMGSVGTGTPSDLIHYENEPNSVLSVGGDVEVRREFRQGWLFAANYNIQHTQYMGTTLADPTLVNAPNHQGGLRMVAPLFEPYANAAVRLTVVAPRRVRIDEDLWTAPAVLGDFVVSGQVPRLGLRYAIGVYNILDWRWDVPVTSSFASKTIQQQGRTFALHLTAAF